jgi:signal peptidase I
MDLGTLARQRPSVIVAQVRRLTARNGSAKAKTPAGKLVELVTIVAVAVGLALGIQAFLVKPYRIPSPSMENTLAVGQRVLVNRIGNRFGAPHVGQIVVFNPPTGAATEGCAQADRGNGAACAVPGLHRDSTTFIKRLVAVGGDRISIRGGHLIRNGRPEADGYTLPCTGGSGCDFPTTITVPKGTFFMMGDNRGNSDDSRYWGPVPRAWIIGTAFASYWPPKRIGSL